MKPQVRQSTFDIAIQQCGSIEAVFNMTLLNDISVTDDLSTGNPLTIPDPKDDRVVSYYTINKITPATAITLDEVAHTIAEEGIEFWAIGYDFIIS